MKRSRIYPWFYIVIPFIYLIAGIGTVMLYIYCGLYLLWDKYIRIDGKCIDCRYWEQVGRTTTCKCKLSGKVTKSDHVCWKFKGRE